MFLSPDRGLKCWSNGEHKPAWCSDELESLGEPSAEAPLVGELVTVEIELPANHVFSRKCIQCQTTIVRVAPIEKDLFRVAFSINQMKFGELMTRITHLSDVEIGAVERPV